MTVDVQLLSRWRIAAVGLALAAVVGLTGCGEEDEDPCSAVICAEGQQCVDGDCESIPTADCEPECAAGEECIDERCVAEDGGCDHHGQSCSLSEHLEWDDDYLCLDWETGTGQEAVCSQDCRTGPCPEGSECFVVVPGFVAPCSGADDCGDNEICHDGQCVVATCRPSQCDLADGPDADCPDGERCARAGESGDYCVPEGGRAVGDDCLDAITAWEQNRSGEACVAEAACVAGNCKRLCVDGVCPDENGDCSVRSVGDFNAEVEVCSASCTPGESDEQCDADETCLPTSGGDGSCHPAGTVAPFEPCHLEGEDCQPGLICAEREGDEMLGRCLPVCDLSVAEPDEDGVLGSDAQAARDDTCPQVEQEKGLWMAWHLATAVEPVDLYIDGDVEPVDEIDAGAFASLSSQEIYQIREQGRVQWAVRERGAPSTDAPLAEGNFELESGQMKILTLVPEPGRDRALEAEVIPFDDVESTQWVHGIPDLEAVDLWAADESGDAEMWIDGWSFGEAAARGGDAGTFELWAVEQGTGEDGERLLEFEDMELDGEERFVALHGTINDGDIHAIGPPLIRFDTVPDLESESSLPMTCRAVNDGHIGGCMERCDGGDGLTLGQCSGEQMGCGPRWHLERRQWTSVCQPVGDIEEDEPCNPIASRPCAEGLFCEEYGVEAEHVETSNQTGLCTALCVLGDDEGCGEERGCRQIDESGQYDIGECRHTCVPDGGYEGSECPPGKRQCRPEARLVPAGDGVTSAFEIEELPSFCWVSGNAGPGDACLPGDCTPNGECLYERSHQSGLVETLLSPYLGVGAAGLKCRAICDPFTNERSDHECADDETCLFNYPWNANVGHCAELVEDKEIGEACDEPGMACGQDSICVADGSGAQCMRLCQFIGQGDSGYAQSTCPFGFTCQPLVNDIGICD